MKFLLLAMILIGCTAKKTEAPATSESPSTSTPDSIEEEKFQFSHLAEVSVILAGGNIRFDAPLDTFATNGEVVIFANDAPDVFADASELGSFNFRFQIDQGQLLEVSKPITITYRVDGSSLIGQGLDLLSLTTDDFAVIMNHVNESGNVTQQIAPYFTLAVEDSTLIFTWESLQAAGAVTVLYFPGSKNIPSDYDQPEGNSTTDIEPPSTAGTSIASSNLKGGSIDISWTAATDNVTPQASIKYCVYYSLVSGMNSVAAAEAAELTGECENGITGYTLLGLVPNTTYYFTVVAEDLSSQKTVYPEQSASTTVPAQADIHFITLPTGGTGFYGTQYNFRTSGVMSSDEEAIDDPSATLMLAHSSSLALDSANEAVVLGAGIIQMGPPIYGVVIYNERTSGSWGAQTDDAMGHANLTSLFTTSAVAYDSSDKWHGLIQYQADPTSSDVRLSYISNSGVSKTQAYSYPVAPNVSFRDMDIAIDTEDKAHGFFVLQKDASTFTAYVIQNLGTGSAVDITGPCAGVARGTMAVDSKSYLHVAMSCRIAATDTCHVYYATNSTGSWTYQDVSQVKASCTSNTDLNGAGMNAYRLALDNGGRPHILYTDVTATDLELARWNGSTWDIEVIDNSTATESFLAFDSDNVLYALYRISGNIFEVHNRTGSLSAPNMLGAYSALADVSISGAKGNNNR